MPISDRLKCDAIEACLSEIRVQKEDSPGWMWLGRDPPMIFRESRTDRWKLTLPPACPLIAAKDILFPGSFPTRYRRGYNSTKTRQPNPRLGPRKRVVQIGVGLVAISTWPPGNRGPIVGH